MTTEEFNAIFAMREHGSHFVKMLAALYIAADSDNRQIIRNAWPELWARYEAMSNTEETV